MRTKLSFNLVCSVCGSSLEADLDKTNKSFTSALDCSMTMAIFPCDICISKITRPATELINAFRNIQIAATDKSDQKNK